MRVSIAVNYTFPVEFLIKLKRGNMPVLSEYELQVPVFQQKLGKIIHLALINTANHGTFEVSWNSI